MQRLTQLRSGAVLLGALVVVACSGEESSLFGHGVGGSTSTSGGAGGGSGAASGSGGAAQDGGPDLDGGSDASPDGPVGPPVCGDGWRDPATEECDDGSSVAGDACTDACRVTDMLVQPVPHRLLGIGPHVMAAGPAGFAVLMRQDVNPPPFELAFFGPKGGPLGDPQGISAGSTTSSFSEASVAALPDGTYVAAWGDEGGDGDAYGVAIRRVGPGLPVVGKPAFANETTQFDQIDPDVLWTGSELVVAWTDADINYLTVRMRTFDAQMMPTSGEQLVSPATGAHAECALAGFEGGWAAAWRSSAGFPFEIDHARAGGVEWTVGPMKAGPTETRPALVELDATHLLLLVTQGESPSGYTLQAALLDVASPGAVVTQPIAQTAPFVAQQRPRLARVGSRIYATWESESSGQLGAEVWLKEIGWDPAAKKLDLTLPELPLPREAADQAGDQYRSGIAAAPLWPEGALAVAWDIQGGVAPKAVSAEFIPVPLLRKP